MILTVHQHTLWGIPLYGLFYFLGSFTALAIAFGVVRRVSGYQHIHIFDGIGLTWLSGVVGAKMLALGLMPQSFSDIIRTWGWMNLFEGGYHLFGGFALGSVVFALCVWGWKLPVWKSIHVLLLSALPGLAVGRLGCVFAGCCFGIETTNFPVVMSYDPQVYSALLSQGTRFPTQLINAGTSFLLSILVWGATFRLSWQVNTFRVMGGLMATVFIVLGGVRFWEEFYRDPLSEVHVPILKGLFLNQWVALFLASGGVIVGGLWMWRNYAVRSQTSVNS